MLSDADAEDHYSPSVRQLEIARHESGSCGFHLTRSKWDPYPWVCGVDSGSAAHTAGLKTGDCVLEVNGEDIIGQRITEVAQLVRKNTHVTLLLWNVGSDQQCSPETICCGPMPTNLQRLTACMSSILTFLECPICLDTIGPPTYQCDNGHLICLRCRAKSERCPVCRIRFTRGRCLLSDQVYAAITNAFGLKEDSNEVRTAKIQEIFKLRNKNKSIPAIKVTQVQTKKFVAKLAGKSSSVDNLSTNDNAVATLSLNNEFSVNLKAKSLSANEIFVSPVVSSAGSITRINRSNLNADTNRLDVSSGPASYHGSYESLASNYNTSSHNTIFRSQAEKDINFHCPYDSECSATIRGNDIIDHFQHFHVGPLVQYFKLPVNLTLENILRQNNVCCLIRNDKNVFFLNIATNLKKEQPSSFPDIHLWMWCLGDKAKSGHYYLSVKLFSDLQEIPMLSIQSAVYSLSDVSWKTVVDSKKGLFLSGGTTAVLWKSSTNIRVNIEITKSDENT